MPAAPVASVAVTAMVTALECRAEYVFDPASGNTATITFAATTARHVRVPFTANTGRRCTPAP